MNAAFVAGLVAGVEFHSTDHVQGGFNGGASGEVAFEQVVGAGAVVVVDGGEGYHKLIVRTVGWNAVLDAASLRFSLVP